MVLDRFIEAIRPHALPELARNLLDNPDQSSLAGRPMERRMSSSQQPAFLIGFNKCGTTSFHDHFTANGIASVHWRATPGPGPAPHRRRPTTAGRRRFAYTDRNCIPGSPWGQQQRSRLHRRLP